MHVAKETKGVEEEEKQEETPHSAPEVVKRIEYFIGDGS